MFSCYFCFMAKFKLKWILLLVVGDLPPVFNVVQALQKFEEASHRYKVFQSRSLLYNAFYKRIVKKIQDSDHFVTRAISEASQGGSDYDLNWAQKHRAFWREPCKNKLTSVAYNDITECFIFLFKPWLIVGSLY